MLVLHAEGGFPRTDRQQQPMAWLQGWLGSLGSDPRLPSSQVSHLAGDGTEDGMSKLMTGICCCRASACLESYNTRYSILRVTVRISSRTVGLCPGADYQNTTYHKQTTTPCDPSYRVLQAQQRHQAAKQANRHSAHRQPQREFQGRIFSLLLYTTPHPLIPQDKIARTTGLEPFRRLGA